MAWIKRRLQRRSSPSTQKLDTSVIRTRYMTDYSFKNGLYWAASQLEEDEMGNSFGIYFDYDLYYQLRTQIFLLTFEMGNW